MLNSFASTTSDGPSANIDGDAVVTTGQAVALDASQLRALVLETLNTGDPSAAHAEESFWRAVAAHHNVEPMSTSAETAKRVFAELDLAWDEDYVEEDEGEDGLAVAALEALQARLSEAPADEGREDDEDDDSWSWSDFKLDASKQDLPVKFLVSEIRSEDLVVNPEWQRAYVWSPEKQRRLIESILLGLPIPSFLFHVDSTTGRTYVIDGRQRLETLSRFLSPKLARGEKRLRFKTFKADEPGWRPGEPLNAAAGKHFDELPAEFRTKLVNAPLVINQFKDLPSAALYQIFKRYNTGAVALKAQEIRNAVYQASPLHQMMYRVAGEHEPHDRYIDDRERHVATALRLTMGRQKERYGAYALVGRFFGFRYMSVGSVSVARATNEFMAKHEHVGEAEVEAFRAAYIDAFLATARWYGNNAFVKSEAEPKWHAFYATLQMVGSSFLLEEVAAGRLTDLQANTAVASKWPAFAAKNGAEKQNSKLFWDAQREWVHTLRLALGLSAV